MTVAAAALAVGALACDPPVDSTPLTGDPRVGQPFEPEARPPAGDPAPPEAAEPAPPAPDDPPPLRPLPDAGRMVPPPFHHPEAARVVAFGDVHGDLRAATAALTTAGVIDDAGHWSGGETVVVQVGDQLDRGDDEREILEWFERLADEADAVGGAFYVLLGNHEVMNVSGDLRYVTPGGFDDFDDERRALPPERQATQRERQGRVAAFAPGGRYARLLARHNLVMQVGDSLFVHGGLRPDHVDYGLDRINRETQAWMRGEAQQPGILTDANAPIWTRYLSYTPTPADCADLDAVLAEAGAMRLVVAHTVQIEGITAGCDDKVWRVDTGMASYYGGPIEVLEIIGAQAIPIR